MGKEATSKHAVVRFDGGSRGNPGPAASGFVLEVDGEVILEEGHYLGKATNNEAEYDGLMRGLARAKEFGFASVTVYGDSQLIIRQMTGQYKVRAEHLKSLHLQAKELAGGFSSVKFEYVPRKENAAADKILNKALDEKADVME